MRHAARSNGSRRRSAHLTASARAAGLIAAGLALLALAWPAAAPRAQDLERGRVLYETRCTACHERSVHRRESRIATDFAALRAEVARWSATAGGEWRAEEVDLVATYLNDRYYRHPCPASICVVPPRAAGARPRS